MSPSEKMSIVILTHNRQPEIIRTLEFLLCDPGAPKICVVDNASRDGTAEAIRRKFPVVQLVQLSENQGAAGRNHGVRAVHTPYVAFCDDDTWWAPGSLARACTMLDSYPALAVVTARVLVGPEEREDPTSRRMESSPLQNVLDVAEISIVAGMMAGACIVRRQAFLAAGGYEPRFFLGGEESLLSLDLMAAGWILAYAPALVVHHYPSSQRDSGRRRRLLLRNALWCAWLRRPLGSALRETARHLRAAGKAGLSGVLAETLRGMPWVLSHRRVIPAHIEWQLQHLENNEMPPRGFAG
ncbi:MAG: glycosyltransferase family 2 protein [Bacteroidota bacterium]